ncbi:F-box-like protein [Ceratobasidium sp. AG-Ba]|nr:F-box-like protein [Ceratobasidium sp. AG-Ba]
MLNQLQPDHVFEVEDIVNMICDYVSQKSDLARLTRVSWSFYHCAIPRLWRDISGVQMFFDLFSIDYKTGSSEGILCQRLPNQTRFSRFALYASLVRTLHLPFSTTEEKQKWNNLLATVPIRPLLPKLRELKLCSENDLKIDSAQGDTWAECLLCPTLTDVHVHAKSLGDFSSSFKLRTLVTTVDVLRPTLLGWLSTLPHLESIDIQPFARWVPWGNTDDIDVTVGLNLPEESFPALRHLALHQAPSWMIAELWNVPALVQELISVEIEFRPGDPVPARDISEI